MKKILRIFSRYLFLSLMTLPVIAGAQNGLAIPVAPGPEDLVLDTLTGAPRLIVACTQRRKGEPYSADFYTIDLASNTAQLLPRTGEPEDWKIHLHGIDLVQSDEGENLLYAISHGLSEGDKTQYVLIYEVFQDHLELITFLGDPDHLISPNDLCATADGRIYVGNDLGTGFGLIVKFLLGSKSSKISLYRDGKWSFAAEKIRYANGVRIDGDKLYCATTASGKLLQWRIDENGNLVDKEVIIEGLKGLDNIEFLDHNTLVVPRHPENNKFLKHRKEPEAISPTWVYTIDLAGKDYKRIFKDDGNNISAGSTALTYKGKLYIAQVFNPFVYVVDLK